MGILAHQPDIECIDYEKIFEKPTAGFCRLASQSTKLVCVRKPVDTCDTEKNKLVVGLIRRLVVVYLDFPKMFLL